MGRAPEKLRPLRPAWAFRGQQDADWELSTTLERSGSLYPGTDEVSLLRRFSRRAKAHLPLAFIPSDGDVLAWMAIMQHYGAPTRLLDFTRSPYVAMFFAFERPSSTARDRAVWALNVNLCQHLFADLLARGKEIQREHAWLLATFNQVELVQRLYRQGNVLGVVPVEPWNLDLRQEAQQTQLLVPGRADQSLMANLDAMPRCRGLITKIRIPDRLRAEILEELALMNVTAASLFPGLDGFGRSMQSYLSLQSPSETQQRQILDILRDS